MEDQEDMMKWNSCSFQELVDSLVLLLHMLLWLHCGCIVITCTFCSVIVVHVFLFCLVHCINLGQPFLIEPPLSSLVLVCKSSFRLLYITPMLCSSWEPYRLLVHLAQSMIWACTRGSRWYQNSADESGQLSNGSRRSFPHLQPSCFKSVLSKKFCCSGMTIVELWSSAGLSGLVPIHCLT